MLTYSDVPTTQLRIGFSVEKITTRAITTATLNFYVVLAWIAPTTFDNTRSPLLFHPQRGCDPRIKGDICDHSLEPNDGRGRTGDGLKTALKADSHKISSPRNMDSKQSNKFNIFNASSVNNSCDVKN
ncbi:hypothetical protein TNCV_4139811 [Trichonephila clavipes]|nr:hypothetical protein TNCV_4139811 [Trichonephila clavipes]